MAKGKLIVFEGIDGVGKATQVALLAKKLRAEGRTVTTFSIPRYKRAIGKLIKNALHGEYGDFRHLDPHLSAMPYFMDYMLGKEEFERALKKGDVIFDRYVQSTFAYHGAKLKGRERRSLLREMKKFAFTDMELPRPDAIFYLDVPPTVSRALMHKRVKDQHERDQLYQKEVAATYAELARAGKNWHIIDCAPKGNMRPRADIAGEVRKRLER